MFGYVRPRKGELLVREYEVFQAMYCGLCHTLARRFGPAGRLFLSYDMCFLAVLLSSVESGAGGACAENACCASCKYRKKRCVASPFRKKTYAPPNAALEFAADASVILFYWKLRDGARDEGGLRAALLFLLSLLARFFYRKAKKARPAYAAGVEREMNALWELEAANTPSIDRTAHTFAEILRLAAVDAGGTDEIRVQRPLGQLLYHVGRWVYILDAWDDLEEDLRRKVYNPIAARYGLADKNTAPEVGSEISRTLSHSAATAAAAAELLALGEFDHIVKNVLYLGLPGVAENVFSGRPDKRSRKHAGSL